MKGLTHCRSRNQRTMTNTSRGHDQALKAMIAIVIGRQMPNSQESDERVTLMMLEVR